MFIRFPKPQPQATIIHKHLKGKRIPDLVISIFFNIYQYIFQYFHIHNENNNIIIYVHIVLSSFELNWTEIWCCRTNVEPYCWGTLPFLQSSTPLPLPITPNTHRGVSNDLIRVSRLPGWPDWAIFRLFGDCNFGQFFNCRRRRNF
jgi:hypothetical protein